MTEDCSEALFLALRTIRRLTPVPESKRKIKGIIDGDSCIKKTKD